MRTLHTWFLVVTIVISTGRPVRANLPPVHRQILLKQTLGSPVTVTRIESQVIEFSGPVSAPRHVHPGPVAGLILAGTIRFQVDGRPAQLLHAGDAFLEPVGVTIVHFDNPGPAPARFLAVYLVGRTDDALIHLLSPSLSTTTPPPSSHANLAN